MLSVLFLTASVTFAQDDKKHEAKQEPKKEKKEEKKEEKPAGGTRMAINEKGLPGTKKNTNSSSKSSSSSTVTSTDKK